MSRCVRAPLADHRALLLVAVGGDISAKYFGYKERYP